MKYKIKELSELLDVSSNTIRRYEKLGYLNPKRTQSGNYRFYTTEDVSKTMFVRFFRKLGFTHPDIFKILSQNTSASIPLCKQYMANMDEEIEKLTKSRHLLKDYIQLMETQPQYLQNFHVRDTVPLYYTIFCSNQKIYNEPERLSIIKKYMYQAPETHMIYVFRKEDILNNVLNYECGWAIKPKDMISLGYEKNAYTEFYSPAKTLITEVEIPIDIDKYMGSISNLPSTLLKSAYDYMKNNNYKLAGDVIGIRISLASHNDKSVQYLLLNIPIEENV